MASYGDSRSSNAICSAVSLNTNKAGMQGVDKERINKIILEASKGSKWYENELRKEAGIQKQVEEMRSKRAVLSVDDISFASREVDRLVSYLESMRDLSHYIIHVDMDAFYAAVEERDNPELKETPLAVGGMSMLSTSNYAARQYGVRAAMPGFIAKKLCPDLLIVEPNFGKYQHASSLAQDVFRDYDPAFRMMSLDEAFLDLSLHMSSRETSDHSQRTFEVLQEDGSLASTTFDRDVDSAVNEIRKRVFTATGGLSCSAGIAANCLLAKMCSDKNKPDGQFRLPNDRDQILEFIRSQPMRKVNGIGRVTEQMLKGLAIETCADMFEARYILFHLFTRVSFMYFLRASLGIGALPEPPDSHSSRKSMSVERTFTAVHDPEQLSDILQDLCNSLGADLSEKSLAGRNITVKLKLSNFEVRTRAMMMKGFESDPRILYKYAKQILDKFISEFGSNLSVRLMGVRVAKFPGKEERLKKVTDLFKKRNLKIDRQPALEPGTIKSGISTQNATCDVATVSTGLHADYISATSPILFESDEVDEGCSAGVESAEMEDQPSAPAHPSPEAPIQISPGPVIASPEVEVVEETSLELPTTCLRQSRSAEVVTCPVCGLEVDSSTDINDHIDSCLTRKEIRNILKEQQSLTNNASSANEPNVRSSQSSRGKKRKPLQATSGATKRTRTSKNVQSQPTLNNFFR